MNIINENDFPNTEGNKTILIELFKSFFYSSNLSYLKLQAENRVNCVVSKYSEDSESESDTKLKEMPCEVFDAPEYPYSKFSSKMEWFEWWE
jgi:hypothetical protein